MGQRIFGIEWAPLNIPLARRLQTLAVSLYVFIFFFAGIISTLLFIYLLRTQFYWITILYVLWLWWSRNASSCGGRRWPWLRQAAIYEYLRDYFPVTLVKTADLDPSQKYILGYHPHGVMGFGTANFCSDVTGFKEKFPGITPYVLALKLLHFLPVTRDFLMAMGCCDVTKESIDYIFRRNGTAVVILIGGAKESFEGHDKVTSLVLKERKGFVKMALKHGAHLVPCFSFGEDQVYRPLFDGSGSRVKKMQRFFQKRLGYAMNLINGRGFFQYSFGLIPRRIAIVTVVGRPIVVEKDEHPSIGKVTELHDRYMKELKELFEENKSKHGHSEKRLEFIA